jgi:hypothetical protein
MRHANRFKFSAKAACPALFALACATGQFFCTVTPVAGDGPPKVANRIQANNANGANGPASHQLLPFIELARTSRDAVKAVKDYEAIFTKKELVGRTLYSGQMFIKLRHDPFSVYLRFIDQNKGREVLYAGPRYQYLMKAHEAPGTFSALAGTIAIEPNSPRAMAEGRYPITRIGMVKMMETLIVGWESEMKLNDPDDPKVYYYPNAKLADKIECKACITRHENAKHQYRFYETRVFFDKKSNFPIRLEEYGPPNAANPDGYLIEQYIYTNIRTNVGLSDNDFDTRNPQYHF